MARVVKRRKKRHAATLAELDAIYILDIPSEIQIEMLGRDEFLAAAIRAARERPAVSASALRTLWKRVRAECIAQCIANEPGTRPGAWWGYEYKGRSRGRNERYSEFVLDVLDMGADEQSAVRAEADDDAEWDLYVTWGEPMERPE